MALYNLLVVAKSVCGVVMIVDVDVGNTRVKWRVRHDSGVNTHGVHKTFDDAAKEIGVQGVPTRIRLSSVGNGSVTREVETAAAHWGCIVQKAQTTKNAGGITCGYERPESMGVDRWLALLAAWQQYQGACVVVDAGSAVTIDVLDSAGRHRGGYIVPGVMMMRNSLLGGTANILLSEGFRREVTLGVSTQEAVDHGALLMLRSFVEAVHEELLCSEANAKIFVTGGDGEMLVPLKDREAVYCKDLVLDGLAVLFP